MALSQRETDELLRLLRLTKDEEIDCDECLSHVAELAEKVLEGQLVSTVLQAVQHHLTVCAECHEEYEALQRALEEPTRPA